jgi:hypothetical protein
MKTIVIVTDKHAGLPLQAADFVIYLTWGDTWAIQNDQGINTERNTLAEALAFAADLIDPEEVTA